MNKQLYENIVNSISKSIKQSLSESLFDDEEVFGDEDNVIHSSMVMDNQMIDIIKNTLAQHEYKYHQVTPDENDGLPLILEDPENPTLYYIAPFRTYKSCGFGPRKRKNYTYAYFYRYILEYTENGIDLIVLRTNSTSRLIFNTQLIQFISQTYDKICSITFRDYGNDIVVSNPVENIMFITGTFNDKTFSDKFVKNFPNVIKPGEVDYYLGELNPATSAMTEVYRKWFSSDEMFLTFVEKLCANGFNVKDEDFFVYNQKTIEERKKELLSGAQDKQIEEERNENLQFIIKTLGEDYVEKFNKILQYFQDNNKKLYLKNINTLRTCKIACNDTLYKFQKDNNLYPQFDGYGYNEYTANGAIVLYKMFCIMKQEKLNDWSIRYDYTDCYKGVDTGFGYRSLDFNDLPIKLDSVKKLYVLYYVMGKAATQCYGILKDPNEYWRLTDKYIDSYNSDKIFTKNMNFDYLTQQLKTIIDKTCKKYKL